MTEQELELYERLNSLVNLNWQSLYHGKDMAREISQEIEVCRDLLRRCTTIYHTTTTTTPPGYHTTTAEVNSGWRWTPNGWVSSREIIPGQPATNCSDEPPCEKKETWRDRPPLL